MKKHIYILLFFSLGVIMYSFGQDRKTFKVKDILRYCDNQLKRTLGELKDSSFMPRSMNSGQKKWSLVGIHDWTSGFWPGILWYDYEYFRNDRIKEKAIQYTEYLQPLVNPNQKVDHDIGFQIFCSYGNAYRLTGDEKYKKIILEAAAKLSELYNPVVGTILSWPNMVQKMGWPHNTIIDNMMNLEILFWASKNGGDKRYYDMAVSHAMVTKKNAFRENGSCFHVAVYDTISGKFIKGVTNQGYSDGSMWARGQAWAIYGYTMVYRETLDKQFLRFAEKVANIYLDRLPEDYIPYWDFDLPSIQDEPKDASAAAIASSALLELAQLEDNKEMAERYRSAAIVMLNNLSSKKYQSRNANNSFLKHCTGNHPSKYEIDASIIYADYYYIEALTRYNFTCNALRPYMRSSK
ncbi:MAG: glycoside hydrolase family 88 protein [Bacteroidota bacterium]|nr:glycoside hydrolase family 88 protein [Bacteroidota bacterium]